MGRVEDAVSNYRVKLTLAKIAGMDSNESLDAIVKRICMLIFLSQQRKERISE